MVIKWMVGGFHSIAPCPSRLKVLFEVFTAHRATVYLANRRTYIFGGSWAAREDGGGRES